MKPLARILAATDLSAPSRHAIARALRLAARHDSDLVILHVIELTALDSLRDLMGDDLSAVKSALAADARARLERLIHEAQKEQGGSARLSLVEGHPLDVIAAEADAYAADLVVLGARGESFLRRMLMGSTAMRLIRKAIQRPVLVVRPAPHGDYRRVLVTVDFSPVSSSALRYAKRIAPDAELYLLHAYELPYEGKLTYAGVDEAVIRRYIQEAGEQRRQQLHALAAAAGLSATDYVGRVVHGDAALQILAMEQEIDADLIVVGKHGTHLSEELLLGSVTKQVLAGTQCDVLVMHDARPAPELGR